eukprot:96423-Chlamydomonas_euryale.AAC.1
MVMTPAPSMSQLLHGDDGGATSGSGGGAHAVAAQAAAAAPSGSGAIASGPAPRNSLPRSVAAAAAAASSAASTAAAAVFGSHAGDRHGSGGMQAASLAQPPLPRSSGSMAAVLPPTALPPPPLPPLPHVLASESFVSAVAAANDAAWCGDGGAAPLQQLLMSQLRRVELVLLHSASPSAPLPSGTA